MTTNLDQLTPAQLRRVDALISDKILGREVTWCAGEPIPKEYEDSPIWYSSDRPEGYLAEVVPHFTSDPAAALSLLARYGRVQLELSPGNPIWCEIDLPEHPYEVSATASTLPLAICQAVAEAEGLEVGEVLNGPT